MTQITINPENFESASEFVAAFNKAVAKGTGFNIPDCDHICSKQYKWELPIPHTIDCDQPLIKLDHMLDQDTHIGMRSYYIPMNEEMYFRLELELSESFLDGHAVLPFNTEMDWIVNSIKTLTDVGLRTQDDANYAIHVIASQFRVITFRMNNGKLFRVPDEIANDLEQDLYQAVTHMNDVWLVWSDVVKKVIHMGVTRLTAYAIPGPTSPIDL